MLRRCGGQFRLAPSGRVVGLDYAAVMALASAMGACPTALAQFMPDVEAVALSALNSGADASADGGSGFGFSEEE